MTLGFIDSISRCIGYGLGSSKVYYNNAGYIITKELVVFSLNNIYL